ncbi:hypothetical protein NP284_06630 [Rhodopseudomonas pseudopalustris]|uniref:hypothetical protein n=1 Tax=Rhodopseudomonas pseudopalustris TaxID=1513892 RepID=UPI003F9E7C54
MWITHVDMPPHPDLLPAGGEKERAAASRRQSLAAKAVLAEWMPVRVKKARQTKMLERCCGFHPNRKRAHRSQHKPPSAPPRSHQFAANPVAFAFGRSFAL